MKYVCVLVSMICLVMSGCRKALDSDVRISARSTNMEMDRLRPGFPPRPDTILRPVFPKPKLPFMDLGPISVASQCIYSYDDLIAVLGKDRAQAKAVVLQNEITISLSENLAAIMYTAVPDVRGSSLFRSDLMVEWRPDPSVYWGGFSMEVWSLGCVYENAAVGPFTNILKGGVEILINTCFIWGVGEYAGTRIKYIVLD